jgi:ABC-type dipeptide/oligopeptide/nickel transport system permease subunit
MVGALTAITGLALAGQLGAELFGWLAGLVGEPDSLVQLEHNLRGKKTHSASKLVIIIILLIPIGIFISGLLVDQEKIYMTNVQDRLSSPSPEYPWGTDSIGRDVQVRVLHSTAVVLGMAGGAAVISQIPGGVIGGLAGRLDSRKRFWSESAADIMLLPANVLMLIPAVPAAVILHIAFISNDSGVLARIGIFSIILLPRVIQAARKLWKVSEKRGRWGSLALSGIGIIFLKTMYRGVWLITALEFIGYYLGFGIRPPEPSLGGLLADGSNYLSSHPEQILSVTFVIWICSFALYASVDVPGCVEEKP